MVTEKQREYQREYRRRNRKKLSSYFKKWRALNKDRWREVYKKSAEKHKDRVKEESKRYYQKHRKKILAKTKRYRRLHPQKYSGRQSKTARRLRNKILEMFGGKCQRCGFSDKRALQVDHKNGGGQKDMKSFPGRYAYYKHVLEVGSKKFQLLCANCNWIKREERGETRKSAKSQV